LNIVQSEDRKTCLAAASLANISLLRIWSEVLTYTASDAYTMKLPASAGQFGAIFVVFGLLTLLFFVLLVWARKSWPGKLVFLLALALPINALREVGSRQVPYLRGDLIRAIGPSHVETVAAAAILLGALVLVKWAPRFYHMAFVCGLVLSPLIPVTVLQGIWAAANYDDTAFRDQPTAPPLGKTAPRRVVWIVFDELGQRSTFDQRPAGVAMPEFEKLRQTALYATAAYSPTSATLSSLPSLITGKLVTSARPAGPGDLRIVYADENNTANEVRWSDEPNVFSRVRAMGFDSALVGWYHPYCRELSRDLTSCWWTAMPFQADSVGRTSAEAAPKYLRSLFETSLLSPFGQSLSTREAARRFQSLMEEARRAVADPSLGLVFLHLQVPHGPHAYDRRSGEFILANAPVQGYLDSLALADVALGDLRRRMEEASVWDSTTVLVSSDHSYRSAQALFNRKIDRRVPFLLKLSRQQSGRVYAPRFNTVVSADLVLRILANEVTTVDEAVAWIDRPGGQFAGVW
jgi:hypothetical protein